jgi:hypothetical protein
MKIMRNMLVTITSAAALAACAPATEHAGLGAPESRTTLVVDNDNIAEVVIYALRGNLRSRIGSVRGLSTGRFTVHDVMLGGQGDLRLLADPVGSTKTYTSPVIHVVPGAEVELQVRQNLKISTFSVFQR